jgi:hypothetical protein
MKLSVILTGLLLAPSSMAYKLDLYGTNGKFVKAEGGFQETDKCINVLSSLGPVDTMDFKRTFWPDKVLRISHYVTVYPLPHCKGEAKAGTFPPRLISFNVPRPVRSYRVKR